MMRLPYRSSLAAIVALSVMLFGLPTVLGGAPALALAPSMQCGEGQIPLEGGGGCVVAPPTPTPIPPTPTPEPPADSEVPPEGEGEQPPEGEEGEEGQGGEGEGEQPPEGEEGEQGQGGEGEGEPPAEGEEREEGEGEPEEDPCTPETCNEEGLRWCAEGVAPRDGDDGPDCVVLPPKCPKGFAENAEGDCYEVLNRSHPCVVAGRVPPGVSTNAALSTYTYIAATGECVTQDEFRNRVQNFEASAEAEREALTELRRTTEEVAAISAAIEETDAELHDVRRKLIAAEDEARYAEIRRDATSRELGAVRATLETERARFRAEAVDAYMGGNSADLVGVILSAENVNELEATLDYATAILDDQRVTIERVEALEARTAELLTDYDDAVVVAEEAAEQIRQVEAEVEAVLADRQDLLAARESRRDIEAEQIAQIRLDKEQYAGDLGSQEEESKEIEQIIAEAQQYQGELDEVPGTMISPLDPLIMGSGFGPRQHPILGYVRAHNGIDLSGQSGALIRATAAGEVIMAGPNGGYGNVVVIDHGDLISTVYAHQSSISVSLGERVQGGDIIGAVGSTGLSTGPHLHFEVRFNGVPIDPAPYLTGQSLIRGADYGEGSADDAEDSDEDDDNSRFDVLELGASGDEEPEVRRGEAIVRFAEPEDNDASVDLTRIEGPEAVLVDGDLRDSSSVDLPPAERSLDAEQESSD